MKSFSRIYTHTSIEQLEPWNPTELDVESTLSPKGDWEEKILEIFHNGKASGQHKQKKRSHPNLHPSGEELSATSWQPADINLRSQARVTKDWSFSDLIDHSHEKRQREIWKEELQPDKEAAKILDQARFQAEEIIREAQAAADKTICQAQDEIALEKKKGYQQGWNEARSEIGDALKAAHAMLEQMHEWQTALLAQGEQILFEMMKEISQTMFGDGINLDTNALRINLNRIMESAQGLGDLNIFLNPRDAKLLDPSWTEYQLLVSGNKVKIIPSEKITPGGCMVKGSMGTVDARVETQLAAVMNTFEEIRASSR